MQGLPITFREEREREKRRRGGEEKRRKKEDERGKGGRRERKRWKKKGERIALAVALLRSGAKYISTFPSRRRRRFSLSFFFIFFFFFHLSPRKNIASRPEDRAQNADKFMRILESSSATLDYSRAFVFFFSFFLLRRVTLKTDRYY